MKRTLLVSLVLLAPAFTFAEDFEAFRATPPVAVSSNSMTSCIVQGHPAAVRGGNLYLVAWSDGMTTALTNSSDICCARVQAGTGASLDSTAIVVCDAPFDQGYAAVAYDGTGTFLVAWQDFRKETDYDIYAARVRAVDGVVLDPGGFAVSASNGVNEARPAVGYANGNFFVAWTDARRYPVYGLWGARVNPGGVVLDPDGIELGSQSTSSIAAVLPTNGTWKGSEEYWWQGLCSWGVVSIASSSNQCLVACNYEKASGGNHDVHRGLFTVDPATGARSATLFTLPDTTGPAGNGNSAPGDGAAPASVTATEAGWFVAGDYWYGAWNLEAALTTFRVSTNLLALDSTNAWPIEYYDTGNYSSGKGQKSFFNSAAAWNGRDALVAMEFNWRDASTFTHSAILLNGCQPSGAPILMTATSALLEVSADTNGACVANPALAGGPDGECLLVYEKDSGISNCAIMARLVTETERAPVIALQPLGQSVGAGTQVVFSAGVRGSTPLSFQWLRNGTAIPGATNWTYTTAPVSNITDMAAYSVFVTNSSGSALSSNALLKVLGFGLPEGVGDFYAANMNSMLAVASPGVLANDLGDGPLTAIKASDPLIGQLTLNGNGSFLYRSPAGWTGTVTFTYLATDGVATSDPATVTITVAATPEYTWDGTTNNWQTAHWRGADSNLYAPASGGVYKVESGVVLETTVAFTGAELRVSAGGTLRHYNSTSVAKARGGLTFAGGTLDTVTLTALAALSPTNGFAVAAGTTSRVAIAGASGELTFSSALFGSGTLAKQGDGRLVLPTASPLFTGTVEVNEGQLQVMLAAPDAVVNVNSGGVLKIVAGTMSNNCLVLAGGTIQRSGATSTLKGVVTVASDSFLGDTLTVGNSALITGCSLSGGGNLDFNTANSSYVLGPGFSSSNYTGALVFSANGGRLALASVNMSAGGLVSTGGYGRISNDTTGTGTLTLQPGAGRACDFSGLLTNGSNSKLALTMAGAGTQTLSGVCQHSGPTLVRGGTLLINGAVTGTGAGITNLAGVLGGTGTIARAVTISSGAMLSPGAPALGVLTINSNLTLAAVCTNRFDLGATNASDRVAVNGNLAWGGVVQVVTHAGFGPSTYTLFTYTGTITTNGTPSALLPPGYTGVLVSAAASKQVQLEVSGGGLSDADADHDGLPDAWEVQYFGTTNAANGAAGEDFDHDGMSNEAEYLAGTNPTNAASKLSLSGPAWQGARSDLVLSWSSVSGRLYSIESGTNLLVGFPDNMSSNIPATPAVNTTTVQVDQVGQRFYRVRVE